MPNEQARYDDYRSAVQRLRQTRSDLLSLLVPIEKTTAFFEEWKKISSTAAEIPVGAAIHMDQRLGDALVTWPANTELHRAFKAWQQALAQVHNALSRLQEDERGMLSSPGATQI